MEFKICHLLLSMTRWKSIERLKKNDNFFLRLQDAKYFKNVQNLIWILFLAKFISCFVFTECYCFWIKWRVLPFNQLWPRKQQNYHDGAPLKNKRNNFTSNNMQWYLKIWTWRTCEINCQINDSVKKLVTAFRDLAGWSATIVDGYLKVELWT